MHLDENTTREILERYHAVPVDLDRYRGYARWALDFFHQREHVANPYWHINLQLDVTRGYELYSSQKESIPELTFTAFLIFHLSKAACGQELLRYRLINDRWYCLDSIPLLTPVRTGDSERLSEIVIEDVQNLDLKSFARRYRLAIDKVHSDKARQMTEPWLFALSMFVGNLPDLQFTGLTLHQARVGSGMPFFYFGKRYREKQTLKVPFMSSLHHGNADPVVLSDVMTVFGSRVSNEITPIDDRQ